MAHATGLRSIPLRRSRAGSWHHPGLVDAITFSRYSACSEEDGPPTGSLKHQGSNNCSDLEAEFQTHYGSRSIPSDRILSLGAAALHALVSLALFRTGAHAVALISLLTAVEQLAVAELLITRQPGTYLNWQHYVYGFNILWSMALSSLITQDMSFRICSTSSSSSPQFWLSVVIDSGVPWLFLHALVLPLPWPKACITHFLALVILILSNSKRCCAFLQDCGTCGVHFGVLQQAVSRGVDIFSAVRPGQGGTDIMSEIYPACIQSYALVQICGYIVAMTALWKMEHAARLAFLAQRRDTKYVHIEMALEDMSSPNMVYHIKHWVSLLMTLLLSAYGIGTVLELVSGVGIPCLGTRT